MFAPFIAAREPEEQGQIEETIVVMMIVMIMMVMTRPMGRWRGKDGEVDRDI